MLQAGDVVICRDGIVTGFIYAYFPTTYRFNLDLGMLNCYVDGGECDS